MYFKLANILDDEKMKSIQQMIDQMSKNEKPSKVIGNRLKELRQARKLTREQVATAIEVSVDTIERIEAGNHHQSVETVTRLAMLYGVTLNFIVLGVSDS